MKCCAVCKAKVEEIIYECRQLNCKYSDLDFDIEFDFKLRRRYCLDSLPPIDDDDDPSKFKPKSVKRVGDIFDDSKFYVNSPTPNNVRQGRIGDCWLVAALGALGNEPSLIEKVSKKLGSMYLCSFAMASRDQKSSMTNCI
jgi:hypothetical protein